MGLNPNFPADLDIRPLTHHDDFKSDVLPSDFDRKFDASSQEEAIRAYGIAGRVWEAAYAMKTFLNPPSGFMFDPAFGDRTCPGPLRILELGSGTGIVAAQLSEQLTGMDGLVIVTDLPEVCPLLEKNLQSHTARRGDPHPSVMVRPLAWGNRDHALSIHGELSGHSLTHIICSDLVYFPELLAPLLRSLIHLTSPPFVKSSHTPYTKVIISYKVRSLAKETPFWSTFGLWFTFEPVLEKRISPKAVEEEGSDGWRRFGAALEGSLFIFVAQRRAESMTWEPPESDEELLGGAGAWGSCLRKGDGTFESLLLMSVDAYD